MREILFRGKTNSGDWVEGYYYIGRASNCPIIYENKKDGGHKCVLPETVGQYTGLTDKNGKKIFEGDIVLVCEKHIDCVVYSCGCFCMQRQMMCYEFTYQIPETIEIIGNKHDNPELLEVEE